MNKKKILVLCTGNSCRSQMMHGYLNFFGGDRVEVYSAGIETHGVNPIAIGVLVKDGVDITKHTSNLIDDYLDIEFDLIITVCDHAKESCPYFPNTKSIIHHSFTDPSKESGTASAIIEQFIMVRNEIKAFANQIISDL